MKSPRNKRRPRPQTKPPPRRRHPGHVRYRLDLPNPLLRPVRPTPAHDVGILRAVYLHDDDFYFAFFSRYPPPGFTGSLWKMANPYGRNTAGKANRQCQRGILLPFYAYLWGVGELYPRGFMRRRFCRCMLGLRGAFVSYPLQNRLTSSTFIMVNPIKL